MVNQDEQPMVGTLFQRPTNEKGVKPIDMSRLRTATREEVIGKLPAELQEFAEKANKVSAELHSDFQGDETPAQMMARMNASLDKAKPRPRRKRPMVRQEPVDETTAFKPVLPSVAERTIQEQEVPQPPVMEQPRVPMAPERVEPPEPRYEPQHPVAPVQEPQQPDQQEPEAPSYAMSPEQMTEMVNQWASQPQVQQAPPRQPMIRQVDEAPQVDLHAEPRKYDAFSMVTALPSKGVVYKAPLYGQALSLIDLLLLEGATPYDTVDIYDEILARRIRGVEPGNIAWCDEAYIFQWLRISSFPKTGIPHKGFTCDECGYVESAPDYQISFKDMEFRMNNDPVKVMESMPNGYYAFNFSDGRECNVWIRKRKHDAVIQQWMNEFIRVNKVRPKAAYLHIASIAAILEIEGCETHAAKFDYLCNLRGRDDYANLTRAINEHSLVATNHVIHTCPRCGAKVDTVYPFRVDEYISNL